MAMVRVRLSLSRIICNVCWQTLSLTEALNHALTCRPLELNRHSRAIFLKYIMRSLLACLRALHPKQLTNRER